jgi:predicted permease
VVPGRGASRLLTALAATRAALARVRELFRSRASAATERDEEFAFHVDMETAENMRRGMGEDEARRAARLRFGATQRFREETSEARGIAVLDHLARDARLALRHLRRAPGFSAGVIATLGIGIGAAAGIGTIVHGVLLRDLPYEEPDRLVRVGFVTEGLPSTGDLHSPTTYFHFARAARSFTALGTHVMSDGYALTDGDAPEGVTMASLAPSTLTLLGARPLIGQLLEPGDSSWSDPRSAILISESLWRRRYGADPSIIGRTIDIDHGARNVVGVLPRSFGFPSPSVDLFYPAPVPVNRPDITYRQTQVIGRLREGVTRAAAEAELNALIPSLSERFPAITPTMLRESRARATVTPLKEASVAAVRPQLLLLGALVAVVLLIATTNVVNLFLLRAERASQEIAIALSLGASRLGLAQRFVIEGLVLGLASTVIALPATALVVSTKFGFTEREIPRLHEVAFTWRTAAMVVMAAMLVGALVGLIALTRTGTTGLFDRLRASRATMSRAWRRVQDGLVAFQVAIALVLLVAAGLLGRSFWNLHAAEIGFAPGDALMFQVSLPYGPTGYGTYAEQATFHANVIDGLRSLPGVASASAARQLPLASSGAPRLSLRLRAGDDAMRPIVPAAGNLAGTAYFGTMGITLRSGRGFRSGDLHGAPAIVLSAGLATQLFGTSDVVGRTVLHVDESEPVAPFRVVGVAGDVHWARIEDGHVPMVYFPLLRDGDGLPPDSTAVPLGPRSVVFVVRGTALPAARTIQALVDRLDGRVPATRIRTLRSLVDDATARVRLTMLLLAVAGAAALLLGVIGVYSVVSYAATGRVREFGIRLALGAEPRRVGGMVFAEGLRLVAVGTVAGLIAALGATRFLRALLFEVEPTSAAEFATATAVLVLVTLVATLVPARRAARTHPAVVLRGE